MFPASDDFIMTQERSSFFDIPRSAIISQHLSLGENFWCVYETKKEIEKGNEIWFKKRSRKTISLIQWDLGKLNRHRYQ